MGVASRSLWCHGACAQCHYITGGSSRGDWPRQCSFRVLPCNVLFKDPWVCLHWWPLFAPGLLGAVLHWWQKQQPECPTAMKCPSRTELESRCRKNIVWCGLICCPETVLWLRFGSEPILGFRGHLFVLSATQGRLISLQFTGACPWKLFQVLHLLQERSMQMYLKIPLYVSVHSSLSLFLVTCCLHIPCGLDKFSAVEAHLSSVIPFWFWSCVAETISVTWSSVRNREMGQWVSYFQYRRAGFWSLHFELLRILLKSVFFYL